MFEFSLPHGHSAVECHKVVSASSRRSHWFSSSFRDGLDTNGQAPSDHGIEQHAREKNGSTLLRRLDDGGSMVHRSRLKGGSQ